MEIPKLCRSINDDDLSVHATLEKFKIEKLEEQIELLKEEKNKLQEKYDLLIERIIDSKLKRRIVKMTPEQEEIVEMFRMEL
jgi:hypothetical protein